MPRTALIVAGAAGPQDIANALLQRFGFGPAVTVLTLNDALVKVRAERIDLLIVPLQAVDGVELATLERELRKHPTTFVIGTAAESDPGLILRAMRSGIHEFLVYPPDPKDLSAAVDRLMRRMHGEGTSGTVIAAYSAKGGLGTTSIAANLAFALAKSHRNGRVALTDMVAGGGDIRVMLNLKPAYDMGDLLKKVDRIDADLLHSLLTPSSAGVWVLPASDDPELADALDAPATLSILEQLRSQFAFTVVDCEHHVSERTLAVLDAADRILLVTQLNVAALRSTQRTLALFQRLGYEGNDKIHVVANRYQSGDVVTIAEAAVALRRTIAFKLPNDYKTSAATVTKGVPVIEYDPSSALAEGYGQIATRLSGGATAKGKVTNNGVHHSRLGRLFSFGRKS